MTPRTPRNRFDAPAGDFGVLYVARDAHGAFIEGLARMGADAQLTSGPDYDLSRRWARAIHEHPRKPDGILYRARHDPSRFCAAIFDRAEPLLRIQPSGRLNARRNRAMLGDVLTTYKFGLV